MIDILTTIKSAIIGAVMIVGSFFGLNQPTELTVGVSLPSIAAVWETSLASPISSSATSLTLTANAIRGGGALSGFSCVTIDEGSAQAENVCGTISGTAMSSLSRGISYANGTSTVAANQFAHRRGANVKQTDAPVLQILKAQANGEDTYPNKLSYTSHPTFTSNTELIDKKYADDTIAGLVGTATETSYGTTKLSVAPASAGVPISVGDNDGRVPTQAENDLLGAIKSGTDFYATTTVGTDAYAITISPAITAYITGMKFRFKADVANTGACTLAVSGLSALAIKKLNDQDTATGDIEAGQIVEVVYDGTDFQMQSQTAQLSGDGSALTNLPPETALITAGETLTVSGNPLLVAVDEGVTTAEQLTNTPSDSTTAYTMDAATKWVAQTFTTPDGENRLKTVVFNGNKINSPTGTLQAEVYAVSGGLPTGAALGTSGAQTAASVGSNADITFTFASAVTLTPNTDYAIVLHHNADGTLDGTNYIQWKGQSGQTGTPSASTNSGSTWAATAGADFRLQTNSYFVSSGTGRLLRSSTSKYNRKKFAGFLSTTTVDGANGTVQVAGIVTGFTGLTAGAKYYVSDTLGAVSPSAGTIKIKVGIALSTTTMLVQIQEVDSNL